jgi:hypothetical protein
MQLKDIFNEKGVGQFIKVFLDLHGNAPAHRALATQKKLALLDSIVLITHPILGIWPRRTAICLLN